MSKKERSVRLLPDEESSIAGFPWSECQVRKLATSHCTNQKLITICPKGKGSMKQRVSFSRHTRESVQSPLVVLKLKVRKGGDFFMASQVMRITLKAYDHQLVDASAKKSSKL